jgi:hypothetical protein
LRPRGILAISWQWSAITGLYQYLSDIGSKPQTQQAGHDTPSAQPKFSGRLPQEQSAAQAPGAAAPGALTAPAVAQRIGLVRLVVVLIILAGVVAAWLFSDLGEQLVELPK